MNLTFIWYPEMFQYFEISLLARVLRLKFMSAAHITFLNILCLHYPLRHDSILTRNFAIFVIIMVLLLPIGSQIVVFGILYGANKDNLLNCNIRILPSGFIYTIKILTSIAVTSIIAFDHILTNQGKQFAALSVEGSGSQEWIKKEPVLGLSGSANERSCNSLQLYYFLCRGYFCYSLRKDFGYVHRNLDRNRFSNTSHILCLLCRVKRDN